GRRAGGDRRGDRLLRGGPGRDLLRGHLLVGVVGVPRLDDVLAPGHLLLVVRQPDRDRAGDGGGVVPAASPAAPGTGCGQGAGGQRRGDADDPVVLHDNSSSSGVGCASGAGPAVLARSRSTVQSTVTDSAGSPARSASSRS